MWKLNQFISGGASDGGGGDREESFLEQDSDAIFNLSTTQRMYAFGGFLVAGFLCMFLSLIVVFKPVKFAVLFIIGNLLAIGSTAFLIGPMQQLRMMFDSTRIIATCVYLAFVVLALISALAIHSRILTIIFIILEICALIWYSLSYIPFARRIVSNLMVRFCDTEI